MKTGRIVVITGAAGGMEAEFVQRVLDSGDTAIAAGLPYIELGRLDISRATFTSIAEIESLLANKITAPIVALGGEKGPGDKVGDGVAMLATA